MQWYAMSPNGAVVTVDTEREARGHYERDLEEYEIGLPSYGQLVPKMIDSLPTKIAFSEVADAVTDALPPLNALANAVWNVARSKGFRENVGDVSIATYVANLHGEVSELWEAYRRGKLFEQCDKDTPETLTCAEEELADIIIRALDTAAELGIDLDRAMRVKLAYNLTRPFKHGKVC